MNGPTAALQCHRHLAWDEGPPRSLPRQRASPVAAISRRRAMSMPRGNQPVDRDTGSATERWGRSSAIAGAGLVVAVGAEWYDDNVPCTRACPVLTNAGRYVSQIAAGDDELAFLTARMPNPFPSICGRVCAAPCELACRRGDLDEPIAIRALKRWGCGGGGVESTHAERLWLEAVERMPSRGERVAIVGAGPAGL